MSVSPPHPATRRIDLVLSRPWFALYAGIRPTVVVGGRGQPAQWGRGTWQVPADSTERIGVFLFTRAWRFGAAELPVDPAVDAPIEYRAPALPWARGRMRQLSAPAAAV